MIILGLTLISELASRILAAKIKNTNPGYHFFDPLEILLWGIFFYRTIRNKKFKIAVLVSAVCLILFSIFSSIFIEGLYKFPDNFLKVEPLIMLLWSTALFIEQIDRPSKENIFKDPIFMVSLSVLWYYINSFLFFQLFNLLTDNDIPDVLRGILYVANYTYYIMLLLTMILQIRKNRLG